MAREVRFGFGEVIEWEVGVVEAEREVKGSRLFGVGFGWVALVEEEVFVFCDPVAFCKCVIVLAFYIFAA